jgi:hypothetical protein
MVAVPWRTLVSAARWNGRPPQPTTIVVSTSENHCQPSNCSRGIMASASTGAVIAAEAHILRAIWDVASSGAVCAWPAASASTAW